MDGILTLNNAPIKVPAGPLSDGTIQRVQQGVAALTVPDGAHLVVLGVLDKQGSKFTAATKIGEHWKLGADASVTWGGHVAGDIFVAGVF